MTVVGVDISTLAVHVAWLEDGKPQRWHVDLGGSKVHVIDRIRAIEIAWPHSMSYDSYDTQDVAIEFPYSVNRDTNAKLMAVLGAVTRQAPPWARVAWPSAGELRFAIGAAKNTKLDAHRALHDLCHVCPHSDDHCILLDWNEHELDSLVACIGWTRILEAQDQ